MLVMQDQFQWELK